MLMHRSSLISATLVAGNGAVVAVELSLSFDHLLFPLITLKCKFFIFDQPLEIALNMYDCTYVLWIIC